MSLEIPTWDKINDPLGSTTAQFGGNWANLISDYYNGVNLALLDATKIPIIGTLTRYKYEKFGLFDVDQSHSITFSVDDIDTGSTRKIKFRRMNTPFEEDYAVLEGLPQAIINKTIDSDLNTLTNIVNADIKAAAGIVYSKLALTNSIVAADLTSDSVTTVKILDANVTLAKLAADSVDSSKIVDGAIVNTDVNASAAIAYSKLALTNSIIAGDITSNAVTTAKILDANVTLAKLAADSVDSSKIVADSIVNSDINSAAAIAWTKLSKTGSILDDIEDVVITTAAQYNIIMRNGSNQWINLVKGSNSTALTVDASGVLAYTTITNAMLAGSIATSKLVDSANFILKTLDNNFGAHYFDMTRIATPADPAANDGRFYIKQIDANNDGVFVKVKKAGSFVEGQIF